MAVAPNRLREARGAAGLSQAELADAAGLSRSAVSAIEAGRNRPSVDAAVALARVLGGSVERLFAPAVERSLPVTGQPMDDGTPVVTARVGSTSVHARADLSAASERWALADAVVAGDAVRDLPQGGDEGFVVVGCDPALSLAASLLPRYGPGRLVVVNGSTRAALAALGGGRAHAALIHGPAGTLAKSPLRVERLHFARWRVGLASRRDARSVATLAAGATVVQREAGASCQQAFERALARDGIEPPRGPVGHGHIDVARRVAAGQGRSGITMEPAALQAGLHFTALEDHVAELRISSAHFSHPGAQALRELLASEAFSRRLALIGGYDLTGSGSSATRRPYVPSSVT